MISFRAIKKQQYNLWNCQMEKGNMSWQILGFKLLLSPLSFRYSSKENLSVLDPKTLDGIVDEIKKYKVFMLITPKLILRIKP